MFMNDIAFFIMALTSIFAIVNPLSTALIFNTITPGDSDAKKKMMAKKAAFVSLIVLIFFALTGDIVLRFFSITIESLKIAGGIFVAYIGFKMLNPTTIYKNLSPEHIKEHIKKPDVSIVPIAIPLSSGPGAISTVLLLASQNRGPISISIILLSIAIVAILTYIILANAKYISRYLGSSGTKVVEKLMGLIIFAIGVQFVLSGIALYAAGF